MLWSTEASEAIMTLGSLFSSKQCNANSTPRNSTLCAERWVCCSFITATSQWRMKNVAPVCPVSSSFEPSVNRNIFCWCWSILFCTIVHNGTGLGFFFNFGCTNGIMSVQGGIADNGVVGRRFRLHRSRLCALVFPIQQHTCKVWKTVCKYT